jgi:hypothetical protein
VVLVLEKAVPEQLKLHDGVILAEIDMFCIINAYDIPFVIWLIAALFCPPKVFNFCTNLAS